MTPRGSPATSRLPAGISSSSRVERRRGTGARARPCRRRAAARPPPRRGGGRSSRSNSLAVGRRRTRDRDDAERPCRATSSTSPSLREAAARHAADRRAGRVGVEVEQVRLAALGPGRAPRRRTPGTAAPGRSGRLLNSGWAWVPTQNGWPRELDELDQPAVGRGARAPRSRVSSKRRAVPRVELVAVAVALGHDRAAVGLGDLRALARARRRRRRGASCRPCR